MQIRSIEYLKLLDYQLKGEIHILIRRAREGSGLQVYQSSAKLEITFLGRTFTIRSMQGKYRNGSLNL